MSYTGTTINESPVIAGEAGDNLGEAAFLAVAFDTDGKMKLPAAGDVPIGILSPETEDVSTGDSLTVQIKDIARWKSSGTFPAGAELSSDTDGMAEAAASGGFVLAVALEPAATAGQVVQVQIIKSGYKA